MDMSLSNFNVPNIRLNKRNLLRKKLLSLMYGITLLYEDELAELGKKAGIGENVLGEEGL